MSFPPRAPSNEVRIAANRLVHGETGLTPQFLAIDSYDVSLERREVIFSAKRKDNFDIGLVSLDGSDIHWIYPDPADEVGPQWAPRGNKVSYIVHTKEADIVRTVHIPTSAQLSADFPDARVRDLRWEPQALRYSVIVSSPDASERIESMTYAGDARRVDTPPAVHLDVSIEPLAGGIVMRPSSMRYGERVPLVVWIDADPLAWSDARGAVVRAGRVAMAVIRGAPDAAFWSAVRDVQWLDPSRMTVVGSSGDAPGVTYIAPSDTIALGRYERRGATLFVAPALVQSFAAGYIADQLKGIPPPNGRR